MGTKDTIGLVRAEVNNRKMGLINNIIINGYRGSFPSPQQASGVFDWKSNICEIIMEEMDTKQASLFSFLNLGKFLPS